MALVASSLWEVCSKNPSLFAYGCKCWFSFGMPLFSYVFAPCPAREGSLLQDVQTEEFHAKMQDPNFLEEAQLIDVREPDEVYAY